jgi:hypothetical protein
MDTIGHVSLTAIVNGVRVIGKFAPYSYSVDTIPVQDPISGDVILRVDTVFNVKKQGEWGYYCYNGPSYNEYYETGELIRRDSFYGVFRKGEREIKIVDSMARIRSIVDLYLRKGEE